MTDIATDMSKEMFQPQDDGTYLIVKNDMVRGALHRGTNDKAGTWYYVPSSGYSTSIDFLTKVLDFMKTLPTSVSTAGAN